VKDSRFKGGGGEFPRYYENMPVMLSFSTLPVGSKLRVKNKAVKKALQVYKTKCVEETNTPEARTFRQNSDQDEHWYRGAWNYLKRDKYAQLRRLALISVLWGIMDVGFCGNALDNPNALATLWHGPQIVTTWDAYLPILMLRQINPEASRTGDTSWWADSEPATTTIYQMLEYNSIRSILAVCIPSLLGSTGAILIVNRFGRKMILVATFLLIALFLTITGGPLITAYHAGQSHTAPLVFYAVIQFVYNLGANTIIVILAAEIFPTVYRGTFYGIAAAGGKVGASISRAIIGKTGNQEMALGIRVLIFIPLMLFAEFLS